MISYLAGFFDGEGSISTNGSASLKVAVTQVLRDPLDLFQHYFGGVVSVERRRNPGNRRPLFVWQIYGRDAASCLWVLLPYLRQKAVEARLGIELAAWSIPSRGSTSAQKALAVESRPLRLALEAALRAAHHQEAAGA